MLTKNLQLTITCLVLSAWTGCCDSEQIKWVIMSLCILKYTLACFQLFFFFNRFGLNIVYTTTGEGECSDPLPRLNLSIRTFKTLDTKGTIGNPTKWEIIQTYKGDVWCLCYYKSIMHKVYYYLYSCCFIYFMYTCLVLIIYKLLSAFHYVGEENTCICNAPW